MSRNCSRQNSTDCSPADTGFPFLFVFKKLNTSRKTNRARSPPIPTSFHSGKGILPTTRHDNHDVHPIGGDHRTKGNVGQELLAIFLSGAELQSGTHDARVGLLHIVRAVFYVYLSQRLGDEDFHRLSNQFGLLVAKQEFRLTIDQMDKAVLVRDDKSDRKAFREFGENLRFQRSSHRNLSEG